MSPAPDTRTHSCHLKAAGGGAEETANLPCLDPVSPPPPPKTSPVLSPQQALPGSCRKAAWPQARWPGSGAGWRVAQRPTERPSAPGLRARRAAERSVSWQRPRRERSRGHSAPRPWACRPALGRQEGPFSLPPISFQKSTQNKERTAVHPPHRSDNHRHSVPIVSTLSLF